MNKPVATEQDVAAVLAVLACGYLVDMPNGEATLQNIVHSFGYDMYTYLDAFEVAAENMDDSVIEEVLKRIITDTIKDVMIKAGQVN